MKTTSAPKDFGDWMRGHGPKQDQPGQPPKPAGGKVVVVVQSGGDGADVYEMQAADAERIRELMSSADGVPDEVDQILERAKRVDIFGTLDVSDDNTGWYSPETLP